MTTVKHFHSAMIGAPVLSGTAGSLIAVLDACLVNGFGLKTADSVVVSGGVATATFSTGHSFETDTIALVDGATPSGLNGENRVLTVDTNTVTFAAPGIADGTATGTITFKLAPAGWEKQFSGANLGAYRSLDVAATRCVLRVNDSNAYNARVVGYEYMTNVNTGSRPFPTNAQVSGGGWWPKASSANATARAWTVVADGKTLMLHTHTITDNVGACGSVWFFGDISSFKSGDAYACALNCANGDLSGYGSNAATTIKAFEHCFPAQGSDLVFMPRSFTAVGSAIKAHQFVESYCQSQGTSGEAIFTSNNYPNGPNNGLTLSRKMILEYNLAIRGSVRGGFIAAQYCHPSFAWRDKVTGVIDGTVRKLLAIKCGAPAGTDGFGVVFIDISGPWA